MKEIIGKAIADCLENKNEFKDKINKDVITFEGKEPIDYNRENWNAVILYNYIFLYKHYFNTSLLVDGVIKSHKDGRVEVAAENEKDKKTFRDIFDVVGDNVYKHYEKLYKEKQWDDNLPKLHDVISDAVSDIKAYNSALRLDKIMCKIFGNGVNFDLADRTSDQPSEARKYLCPDVEIESQSMAIIKHAIYTE